VADPTPHPDETQETFISHLVELRSRLLRAIIAVVVVLHRPFLPQCSNDCW
jgi:Sec-independent protein secretion pathway component TatC